MEEMVTREDVDLVLNAVVGAAGILPTLAAIKAGKDVALANKETLVAAGSVVMRAVKEHMYGCCRWTANTARFSSACKV